MNPEYRAPNQSSFYRLRRDYRGYLKFMGTYLVPRRGYLIEVRTWTGHLFLVDRRGRVRSSVSNGGREGVMPDGRTIRPKTGLRGYASGIESLVEWSTTYGMLES